jgi:Baculovirus FP protein
MERASRSKMNKKSLSTNASLGATTKKPTIDDLMAEINELKTRHQSLHTENLKLKAKMAEMYKDLDFLHSKLNRMEQAQHMNEVEIIGVPETQDEDFSDILKKLFEHVEHPSPTGAIHNVYRKKSAKSVLPGTIVVSFKSFSTKMQFVTATKKKKLTSSFMCTENHRPVYINERLTKHNKYLFYLARDLRRKNFEKYAWTDHGNILVKIDDNTDSMIIDNVSTIERIREKSSQSN